MEEPKVAESLLMRRTIIKVPIEKKPPKEILYLELLSNVKASVAKWSLI